MEILILLFTMGMKPKPFFFPLTHIYTGWWFGTFFIFPYIYLNQT